MMSSNSSFVNVDKKVIYLFSVLAVGFFSFLIWIIYLANTGSSSPFFSMVRGIPYGDKVGHFGLFGVLTLLFNLASRFRTYTFAKINLYWGATVVFVFVLVEELSQGFIDSRTLDIYDLLADCIGIIVFSMFTLIISKRLRKQSFPTSDIK